MNVRVRTFIHETYSCECIQILFSYICSMNVRVRTFIHETYSCECIHIPFSYTYSVNISVRVPLYTSQYDQHNAIREAVLRGVIFMSVSAFL